MKLEAFLRVALPDGEGAWDHRAIMSMARNAVPDVLLGNFPELLQSDISQQWAQWFVESILDPRDPSLASADYTKIFSKVWTAVNLQLAHLALNQRKGIASVVAGAVKNLVKKHRADGERGSLGKSHRRLLLDLAGSPPRCFYCGSPFAIEAIDQFLQLDRREMVLPLLIDVLKPRGLNEQDLRIEVDHVFPFVRGGRDEDNLVLACGWCNRNKGAKSSMYDTSSFPIMAGKNVIGLSSLPNPFWCIRILAVRRKCEFPDGCGKSLETHSLTVAPVARSGALNPINLMVTCLEHDPLGEVRFQSVASIRSIWGKMNPVID